ncbi:hypothetical protein MTO96_039405 [Rhipicephalus appendiculatus]
MWAARVAICGITIACCVVARAASASQGLSSVDNEDSKGGGPSEGATSSLLRGLVASVVPVLQRSFARSNVSALCTEALMDFSKRILRMDIAAWRFLDATGKFPSGILEGTTGDLGAYDECLASRLEPASGDQPSHSSRGQYCSVFLKPKQSRAMDKLIAQLTRYPVIKKRFNLTMARKAIKKGRVRGLRFGLCVPSSCSAAEVEAILGSRKALLHLFYFRLCDALQRQPRPAPRTGPYQSGKL